MDLSKFAVGSVPTLYYIPDYITDVEHDQLVNHVCEAPISKWKSLKNRRLQNWGGVVHEKGLLGQDLPLWLTRITKRISQDSRLFPSAINHVLVNEYLPNQGIMPHQDGPAYFPVVAILSLGSPVVMDFTPHSTLSESENIQSNLSFSILLMPRSLLIFKDSAYSEFLHGIRDCEVQQCDKVINMMEELRQIGVVVNESEDEIGSCGNGFIHRRSKRISLTCRLVNKVHKILFKV